MPPQAEPLVNFAITDGVARLTLNRPQKRNALTRTLIEQLAEAVQSAATDPTVRLLVLAAEGPVFCAGMDLAEMQERAGHPQAAELWQKDTEVYRDLLVSLFTLRVPTLAVVNGPAVAGGLGLVLACDIVLAAESAAFWLPEPRRGITAAVVAPLLFYRIGPGAANYLLLSGRKITAADAHRLGLCHELAADGQLAERERDLIGSILSGAPSALEKTKAHVLDCTAGMLLDQLNAGMKISAEARETSDAREGLAAFLEKRNPSWQTK